MWKYSEKLMDHFMNPRNVGEIEDADGHSEVGSPQCGDAMTLDLLVDDDENIEDVRFRTFGCAAAIASASALTEMVKGEKIGQALDIRNRQIADYLGGMPPEKFHCSVMGREALTSAVADYMRKRDELERAARELLASPPDDIPDALRAARITRAHSKHVWVASEADLPEPDLEWLGLRLSGLTGRRVEARRDET
ncbi:iron-sulfur cluster assembly scaffold protein [Candidatus Fermentibacterales bacterium]|nr:iron-sulfur cluster assembly scaffold protein [Candidatus Fermentibacterales bacterium]